MTDHIIDYISLPAQARRLREKADHYEQLASMAKRDGDKWDEADCRAKAAAARKQARRLEVEP